MRTTAICSRTRSLLRTLSAVAPANVSAQSPPWRRNALPCATWPELGLERVALAGEHQRRQRAQAGDGDVDRGGVRVGRLLRRARARAATPGRGWSPVQGTARASGPPHCRRLTDSGGYVGGHEHEPTCRGRCLRRTGESPDRRSPDPGPRTWAGARRGTSGRGERLRREGLRRPGDPAKLPITLGYEAAGVVAAIGSDVTGWSPGDEVIAFRASGAYTSDLVVGTESLTAKPPGLGWAEASGLMLTGAAAWHTVVATRVGQGDTVLVHAATGGVGLSAVQLARLRGARVIGTTNPRNDDLLRDLGVEPVAYGDGLLDRVRTAGPRRRRRRAGPGRHRRGDGRLIGPRR